VTTEQHCGQPTEVEPEEDRQDGTQDSDKQQQVIRRGTACPAHGKLTQCAGCSMRTSATFSASLINPQVRAVPWPLPGLPPSCRVAKGPAVARTPIRRTVVATVIFMTQSATGCTRAVHQVHERSPPTTTMPTAVPDRPGLPVRGTLRPMTDRSLDRSQNSRVSPLLVPGLALCVLGVALVANGIMGGRSRVRGEAAAPIADASVPWITATLRGEWPPWDHAGPLGWWDAILLGIFTLHLAYVYCHVVVERGSGDLWGRALYTVSHVLLAVSCCSFWHFLDFAIRTRPVESPPVDNSPLILVFGLLIAGGTTGLYGQQLSGIKPILMFGINVKG
jgi:hypothetical protein